MVSAACCCKRAARCKKLLCGSHLVVDGRVGSERAGGHAVGRGLVDDGPRHGRDGDGDVPLQGAVAGRVVRGPVLPAAPHDPTPGAADGAQRAGVVVAAGAGGGVQILRPGVPVAGAVGQRAERAA
jgi:hypothetical protein